MLKRLLPLALSLLLIPAVLPAQQAQDAKPEEEKKPDAFQYFFGKKREEAKKEEAKKEEPKPEEPKAEPEAATEPVVAPEPEPVQPEPAKVEPVQTEPVQPAPAAPKPQPVVKAEPAKAEPIKAEIKSEPEVDAFQYFFGRPAPRAQAKPAAEGEKRPVDAFDYFFGKDGKAGEPEAEEPPPGW